MTNKCCEYLNIHSMLYFYDDRYNYYPCCWADMNQLYNYTHGENINNFFNDLIQMRKYFLKNSDKICLYCPEKKKFIFDEKIQEKTLILGLTSSCFCNINCKYCFQKNIRNGNLFFKEFEKNRLSVEKIISDPRINIIRNCGGEFYANKEMMKMYLNWKEKYGVKIETMTNLTMFDQNYPIDAIQLSWHKAADLETVKKNITLIPDKLFERGKIPIHMMIGESRIAFTIKECFDLLKYIDPSKFIIVYRNIEGILHTTISQELLKKYAYKTLDKKFSMVRVQDGNYNKIFTY